MANGLGERAILYWARFAALDAFYNISETDNHYL
jgi:hypothetical protein